MKNIFQLRNLCMLLCLAVFSMVTSCVDQDFDTPPADPGTSDLVANTTIADLKADLVAGQFEEITEDLIIEAIVVADDESGNFFRQLIIQDNTGGIELRINVNDLYNDYPIGRKIFVKCQGLWLGDFAGKPQMGAGIFVDDDGDTQMASLEAGGLIDHVEKGLRDQAITPKVVNINDLTISIQDPHLNTLIQIDNIEFETPGETFATFDINSGSRFSENRIIRDCDGNEFILRSSGFSDFVNELTPTGTGSILAIYGVFGTTSQLAIRNTSDLSLSGPQCDGSTGGGGGGGNGNEEAMTIADVRALFSGAATNAPADKKIIGTVISDRANSNTTGRNLFIQDDSGAGIVMRFEDNHSFNLNEKIEVVISGLEVSEFNGLLQVNNIPNDNATSVEQGNSFTPRTITIGDLLTQVEALESTLVRFENVTLTKNGGNDFDGAITLNDGTGSITLWTFNFSTFATASFPTDVVNLTGIVSQFNDSQITIRNLDDIEGGNGGGGGGGGGNPGEVDENFSSTTAEQDINLTDWANIAVKGERLWRSKEFSGNKYAQGSAFNDSNPEMEAWLVTPEIDLTTGAKTLNFESAQAFWAHDGLSVWISSDFDGANITAANWTELSCTIAGNNDAEHAWIPSGAIDLSSFSGKVRVGFKHVGNPTDGTTSYRIDNVVAK